MLPTETLEDIALASNCPRKAYQIAVDCNLALAKKIEPFLTRTIDELSRDGELKCLRLWGASGFELEWTYYTMDLASGNGHVAVLDWWLNSGLECRWSDDAMYWASRNGHVAVLDWWLNGGLQLKWSDYAMYWASRSNHVAVRDWWRVNIESIST